MPLLSKWLEVILADMSDVVFVLHLINEDSDSDRAQRIVHALSLKVHVKICSSEEGFALLLVYPF